MTLLGGAYVLLSRDFSSTDAALASIFWSSFTIGSMAFGMSVGFLIRSFYGWIYSSIPLPSEIRKYESGLRAYYAAMDDEAESASTEFAAWLDERYVQAGDRNFANNRNRAEYLHRSNGALVVSVAAVAVCAFPYVLATRAREPQPQRVEIVNLPQEDSQDGEGATAVPAAGDPGAGRPGAGKAGAAAEHRPQGRD